MWIDRRPLACSTLRSTLISRSVCAQGQPAELDRAARSSGARGRPDLRTPAANRIVCCDEEQSGLCSLGRRLLRRRWRRDAEAAQAEVVADLLDALEIVLQRVEPWQMRRSEFGRVSVEEDFSAGKMGRTTAERVVLEVQLQRGARGVGKCQAPARIQERRDGEDRQRTSW